MRDDLDGVLMAAPRDREVFFQIRDVARGHFSRVLEIGGVFPRGCEERFEIGDVIARELFLLEGGVALRGELGNMFCRGGPIEGELELPGEMREQIGVRRDGGTWSAEGGCGLMHAFERERGFARGWGRDQRPVGGGGTSEGGGVKLRETPGID